MDKKLPVSKWKLKQSTTKTLVAHPDYTDNANRDAMWVANQVLQQQYTVTVKKSAGGPKVTFPFKLHDMLDEVDSSENDSVVSWLPHGRAFRVHNRHAFESIVLPLYFKYQSSYESFHRQLNTYGFQRLVGPHQDRNAYYHECFLRGRVHLCALVTRSESASNPSTTVRCMYDPSTEPDFYSMQPLPRSTNTNSATSTTGMNHTMNDPPFNETQSKPLEQTCELFHDQSKLIQHVQHQVPTFQQLVPPRELMMQTMANVGRQSSGHSFASSRHDSTLLSSLFQSDIDSLRNATIDQNPIERPMLLVPRGMNSPWHHYSQRSIATSSSLQSAMLLRGNVPPVALYHTAGFDARETNAYRYHASPESSLAWPENQTRSIPIQTVQQPSLASLVLSMIRHQSQRPMHPGLPFDAASDIPTTATPLVDAAIFLPTNYPLSSSHGHDSPGRLRETSRGECFANVEVASGYSGSDSCNEGSGGSSGNDNDSDWNDDEAQSLDDVFEDQSIESNDDDASLTMSCGSTSSQTIIPIHCPHTKEEERCNGPSGMESQSSLLSPASLEWRMSRSHHSQSPSLFSGDDLQPKTTGTERLDSLDEKSAAEDFSWSGDGGGGVGAPPHDLLEDLSIHSDLSIQSDTDASLTLSCGSTRS